MTFLLLVVALFLGLSALAPSIVGGQTSSSLLVAIAFVASLMGILRLFGSKGA